MSSKRTARTRPRLAVVYNTTPTPRVIDRAGHFCFGSSTAVVDPEDPIAAGLIGRGVLIIQEEA